MVRSEHSEISEILNFFSSISRHMTQNIRQKLEVKILSNIKRWLKVNKIEVNTV